MGAFGRQDKAFNEGCKRFDQSRARQQSSSPGRDVSDEGQWSATSRWAHCTTRQTGVSVGEIAANLAETQAGSGELLIGSFGMKSEVVGWLYSVELTRCPGRVNY